MDNSLAKNDRQDVNEFLGVQRHKGCGHIFWQLYLKEDGRRGVPPRIKAAVPMVIGIL